MLKCYEAGSLGGETASSHPWLRRGKNLHSARLDLERTCATLSPVEVGDLGPVREGLLDNAQGNECSQDPMFWASQADWQELAVVLVNQNICELVGSNETVEGNGKVQSGQHLNMNIKLSNREQNVVMGDMPHLTTSGR